MVYKVKKNWQGDPCLPIEFSWDGLSCSDSNSISLSIISLNLSWSKLTGEIDSSFSSLTSLKYLDLSYNSLTGKVPNFLSKLPALKALNLSGNNLTGSVPLALLEKSRNGSLSLRLDGNPHLCKKNSCEDEEEEGKEKTKNNVIVPVVASIISILVLLLGEVAALWIFKRRQQYDGMKLDSMNCHLSYSEVDRITDNFKKMLGRGASGKVYLGHLSDGTEVAVKMLTPSSVLVFKQFKTEAQLLTRIHHKNLVSLIGYCDEGSRMVLVYEHMAEGNLKEYLSGKKETVLSWERRLRIAIDAAQALEYLHDACNPPIIHRDVKPENILLTKKFQAKVADFGWSRSLPSEGGSYVSTAIVGTPGYIDPEYNRTSLPSKKTDVYSFGIVLLEVISGQPVIIKITKESSCNIADWVRLLTAKGDIKMIVDPRLQGEFEANSARRAVETAMSCVLLSSTDRPTMSDVVVELKECLKIAMVHERTDYAEEDQGPVSIEAVHERTDNVEEDCDPFGSEAAYERTDDAEEDHGPLGVEAAHEVTNNAKEDQGPVGIEAPHERNDSGREGHGCVGIGAAHKRNDNGEEDQCPVGIEAAHERHDDGKEDHGPDGTEAANEITDNAEEDQGLVGIEATQERTDIVEENHGPVGIEAAHERNDNDEEDHGPVGIEATHERTDNVEENHGPLGSEAAMAIQERTNSYGEAKEKKKEKKKNVVVSPVASITSVVVPSDIVVKPNEDDKTFEPKNQHLTYSEVERITENFQKELGKGASAIVYHGHLSNGTEVAVKKLSPSSILGSKQFKTEAQLLTRVHHKNLVSLFGYCDEGSNMVLIYEYMAKGNLKAYLSGNTEAALSWEQRLRIAIDAAQALEYLHNGCNPPIIHRDVKTENILLNEKLQAKVADFGWSKSMPVEGGSYVSTAIVGTPGYLDPDFNGNQDFLTTGSNAKAEEKEKEKDEKKKKKKKKNFIGPAVTSITSVLVPSGALASLGKSKKKWPHAKDKCYRYSEVARITNNFQQVIGCGAFGSVYLGYLSDGTEVAVKLLSSSNIGFQEFQNEVQLLTRIRHKNLVSLLGCHAEGSNIALIYEYMVKGSLKKYLSDENEAVLSWKQRIGIALDVAQGLEYLHDGCNPPIIHRDIKSANILLNEKLQAKVGDMGSSRSLPIDDLTNVSTVVVGTVGYLDPEYLQSNRASMKSDVYSFGVVLLELVSGQPALIKSTDGEFDLLINWVRPLIDRGEIRGIVDPRLNGDFDINSARKAVETAMACVRCSSVERPTMSDITYEIKEWVNCLATATGDVEEDLGSFFIEDAMQ